MLHITGRWGVEFLRVAYKTTVYEWKSRRWVSSVGKNQESEIFTLHTTVNCSWVSSVGKKSRKWNIYFAYNCKLLKSRSWISGVAYECINKNQGDKFKKKIHSMCM